jgi:Protein of unknown function (DUF429)
MRPYDHLTMKTAGIDLSSQAAHTATCVIEWSDQEATVTKLFLKTDDATIKGLIADPEVHKLGIDVPLGWPRAFADAVTGYSAKGPWPTEYLHAANDAYRYRKTDLWVKDNLKKSPLSVSTNLIALPAMRAAALLSTLPDRCARDGSGVVVEVYPAVALRRWGFPSQGYKRKKNLSVRQALVDRLLEETKEWLSVGDKEADLCRRSDDAFDALIAALVARARDCALTEPIPEEHLDSALCEGWIAVPCEGSLIRLATSEPRSTDEK